MRIFSFVLALICVAPLGVAFSQDQQPAGGQFNSQQPQQQRQPAGQAPGQAARAAFSQNVPGNVAPGAAADSAFQQQVSYALGRNFANGLRDHEIEVDMNFLMAGIADTLRGAQPKWSEQQLDAVLEKFGKEVEQKAMMRMQQAATKNQQEAATFLAQNGRQQGVQTTPSGLQYRVLKAGNGGASPTVADIVRCNYQGKLLNGTEFDSSYRRGKPAEFAVNRVIPGWTEALQKMHVGDKWQLFIPPKLAYDMQPPEGAPIEPGSLLVFEIELLDIVKK